MYQATYDNGALSLKINEVEVPLSNVIDTVKLTYDSGTSELACGSLIIPTLEFTLLNTVACVLMDTVELNVGNIPFHKFIVVSADKQEYITKFKAYVEPYERLSKGFFGDLEDGYTVHSMLNEIATKTGVTIDGVDSLPNLPLTRGDVTATGDDGTEQTQKGTNYEGKTYLEQLSLISGFLGKNIIFTRNNHIKFTNLNTTDIVLTDLEKPTRKTNSYSINKIICSTGRDTELVAGSATLSETLSLSNCYMTQEQLNALLTQFQAIEYEAFEFNHAQANLLIEPYDMVSFEYKGQNYVIPVQYLQIVFSAKGANYIVKSFVKQGESAVSEYKGTLTSRVDNVYAEVMQVRQLIANIGQFEEIEAVIGKIDNLYAKVGHIQNLLAGTITSEEINTIHLTSQNAVIDNAIVKSEMIESLAVSKLASGVIDTSKIQIQATNGHMTIADNTIRFIDSNGNTRLYMGEDTNGNFSYQVYNANGSGLLLDENGLKEIAITDGLIKTNMINDQAITGDKINWTSFCESFNSSTNTNTLDSAHITMDGKRLDTAFNQLNTTIQGQAETINTHTSQLTQNANSIQGLITATTITKEDGTTIGVKDEIANMKLTQDNFQVSISERVDNMQIGGTNLAIGTNQGSLNWNWVLQEGDRTISSETIDDINCVKLVKGNTTPHSGWDFVCYDIFARNKITPNTTYTVSFEIKSNKTFDVTAIHLMYGSGSDSLLESSKAISQSVIANSDWTKIIFKLKTKSELPTTTGQVIYISGIKTENGSIHYIRNLKLEKGNVATDWSPAPEDVDTNITNAKNDAISTANNTLNSTIANYYTKEQTNSQINVAKDAINLSVSNTYETKEVVESKTNTALNNAKSYADTKKSEAISTASSDATNKANQAKNDAIASANNTLNTTIANYYTKTETDSQINVAKNEINLGVSSIRTELMNATYSNLLSNSDFLTLENDFPKGYYSNDTSKCYMGGWICPEGGKTIHINTNNGGQWIGFRSSRVRARQDQVFTASVYVAIENGDYVGSRNFGLELDWLGADGNRISTSGHIFTMESVLNWERHSVTGTAPEGTEYVRIYCWHQTTGAAWWGKPMLQIGSVMTAWDRGGDLDTIEQRITSAEQKITDESITNTVKRNFYTKTETENAITNKGYQNSSQVQQTVDNLQIKFSENGGYNLLLNGGFENGTKYWSRNGNFTDSKDVWYPYGNGTSWVIWASEAWAGFFQFFECTVGKHYSWSIDVYVESGAIYVGVDDKNLQYQGVSNGWVNVKGTITATATSLPFCIYSGSEGATVHIDNVIVNEGEIPLPYSPHPSEIYDGIVQIDKNGLKITSSDFGGYTHITSSGFYLNNGSTNVFKADGDGLTVVSDPNTSINGDVIRSGNIVANNGDLTFNLNSGQMYYKYAYNQVGFLGVTDGNSFSLSTDAKGWCMNSDYGSFSSMGAKSVNGGNYVPYLTVTSGGVSNYNAGIFMSMPLNYGSATGTNMTVKNVLELSSKVSGAGLFNPKIAWRGTDVGTGAALFPRSSGDRIDIYTTGDSSTSNIYLRLADDVNTYFNITCNHYTYGHQSIATFRYVASIDGYGIDFYRGLNMHNYNLGNVSLKNARSVQTASLALLDDEATVQTASPIAMFALDNDMEATQATITQHIATSINKTVTFNGTELVEGTSEYIELPQDFLMCVDIQVTLTPNKLCRFAVTSKDEFGFVIETDTEGVTFDYVVIGTKMDGTLFASLHNVEPDTKPVIDEEEEFVKYTTDNLMLPQEFIDKGYTTFADATEEEMEAMKTEQVFGSPVGEDEEVTEETQEDIIIENEDDLNGIDTGTIIENY